MKDENTKDFRAGYAALIGRPNAGKSTLLNHLVGEKIAAVSNKPQTTRHKIQGIVTLDDGQIVFVDTPGVHKPGHLLNRRMMAAVQDAILSVDVVVLMRDASVSTGNGDRFVLDLVKESGKTAVLVLNKIDKIKDKSELLPLIEFYAREYDFAEIVPVSALKGEAIENLLKQIVKHLPAGEAIFAEDEMTDQSMRTIVAEMVREKILQTTGEEIPYVTAVVTERFDESDPNVTKIYCAIYVERASQKGIIIGKGGVKLRDIGSAARIEAEKLLGKKVYLQLFVKVVEDWRNRPRDLDEMGIRESKMRNEKIWFAVDVSLAPPAVEAVEYALSEAGASGTEYSTLGLKEIGVSVTVIGYFDEQPDLKNVKTEIENALVIYNLSPDSIKEITSRTVEDQDWLAEWKKNWRPTETEKFIIAPVWSEIGETDKIIIRIEPSMAFGTGTHETTRLCLKTIEQIYAGESFFDVGTGTGILAIAATKLKFKVQNSESHILACDTDEDSVKIAEENAQINGVKDIEFYVGSISENSPEFDFVCANLTADVIIPLLPLLVEKAKKLLLLSGILREQERWVGDALRELGIRNYEVQTDGEWISILTKNGKLG